MRLVFVRHGESEANVAGIVSDDPARPVALTPRGQDQALEVGRRLSTYRFSGAYVSQFQRAQETARAILHHHPDCAVHVDRRINERSSGMDGLPVSVFHDAVRRDPIHACPTHGESFMDMVVRVSSFLNEVAGRHPHALLLAVSHENPIQAARVAAGLAPEDSLRQGIPNCGFIEIEWP